MKIAVEGCMHGDLDNVYKTLQYIERQRNIKVDLLLCCGDFQAGFGNERDLESLNVPRKYRAMNSFWKYFSGEQVAPVPTIFIGGNHEASNYLWELYYGGWAAPNIYFLGFAGVVKFGNIRIGGLSGIYNARHYRLGHYERPPYNENTIRSVYHVREYDVHKLMQVEERIDIFLSHDWPLGITDCGNSKKLIQQKPFFEKEIFQKTLGNKAAAQLLEELKPTYWFSAHLHCQFAASVQHGVDGPVTNFLALDKCLPGRKFLQIVDIESESGPHEILYDEEWLAITRKFHSVFPLTTKSADFGSVQLDMQDCRQWVRSRLQERGARPFEFERTVPCHNPSQPSSNGSPALPRNPQTESLLQLLELPYLLDVTSESRDPISSPASMIYQGSLGADNEEIPIDDIDELEELEEDNVKTEDEYVQNLDSGVGSHVHLSISCQCMVTPRTIYLLTSPNLLNAALNDDKNQFPLLLRMSCFQQLSSVIISVQNSPESFMETRVFNLNPLVCLVVFLAHVVASSAQLSFGFYAASCPTAEFIVRNTVRSASSSDATIPGKLLRLLFHDCFVEGCDASVLIRGNGTEQSDPANTSLGGFSVIDSAKRVLELFCPGTVSCADIIALAARDAVELTGGPAVQIPTGRKDGRVSAASNVRPNTVDTTFTIDEMIRLFSSKGLSLIDLVTLSGAHTIGAAHCSAFRDRFRADSKGKLLLVDSSLDMTYAEELMTQCPAGASPSITVNNDPDTSLSFDNQYYRNLLLQKGLFQSDSVLIKDNRTREQVENFANDQDSFFASWVQSFLKLSAVEVKTGSAGEVRQSCSVTNR
ncbi:uncharacterized protein LOC115750992 [Rhodamnia argentea]|uniref:peroxidase n=1 Tax=Rhodamnia argentea TaxID=178133 RepID=A0ABM3HBQ9_9MYRT|nr:uncharacterized protein LOC115750992 [Rhodamnia argentea]